ncbi:PRC-barrel domain-containing protein [Croceicoccus mobilis]|uniref:Photosystem reaction center subunit H n=1 Tax=Croceicoccus mobilis TaxID=1703339 RepID=A0A916ZB54_9SPHN|nr:PRC-barrel domain-containing protein [Croceicoccus mobilis]GGD83316.1 photosystem reaction center subunit H [Croceicoccus mobilis]
MANTADRLMDEIQSPTANEGVKRKARDEGHNLIASDRVEGTAVYRPNGDKIGKVHHMMIGKRSGLVEYVIMNFGGFLGLGEEHRPIPWDALDYDPKLGGYVVSAVDDVLQNSPLYTEENEPDWDREYGTYVFGYWGVPYM